MSTEPAGQPVARRGGRIFLWVILGLATAVVGLTVLGLLVGKDVDETDGRDASPKPAVETTAPKTLPRFDSVAALARALACPNVQAAPDDRLGRVEIGRCGSSPGSEDAQIAIFPGPDARERYVDRFESKVPAYEIYGENWMMFTPKDPLRRRALALGAKVAE